jgi:hypothetical protein
MRNSSHPHPHPHPHPRMLVRGIQHAAKLANDSKRTDPETPLVASKLTPPMFRAMLPK